VPPDDAVDVLLDRVARARDDDRARTTIAILEIARLARAAASARGGARG